MSPGGQSYVSLRKKASLNYGSVRPQQPACNKKSDRISLTSKTILRILSPRNRISLACSIRHTAGIFYRHKFSRVLKNTLVDRLFKNAQMQGVQKPKSEA